MSVRLKTKDHPGIWRVTIWKNGFRKEWVIHGSKKEALAFEAKRRLELQTVSLDAIRVAPTFSSFCVGRYQAHAQNKLKPSTWKKKQRTILTTLMVFFGRTKLTEFTTDKIERFITLRRHQGKATSYINTELRVLHRILVVAQRQSIPVQIPVWDYLKERRSRKVAFWTEEEVGRLLAATSDVSPDIYPLVLCIANTGMRCGEAIHLITWADVDLEKREICIQSEEGEGIRDPEGDEAGSPKSKWRLVPINDAILPFLSNPGRPEDPVFPCLSTGNRWACWPDRKFRRACVKAGLKGGPHKLRHSYASHFLKTTPDLFLLSKILGHSHTRVTEIYSHLLPDSLVKARHAVVFPSPIGAAEMKAKQAWGTGDVVEEKDTESGTREMRMAYAIRGSR